MTASKFCLVFSIVLNSACYAAKLPADSVLKNEKGIEVYAGVNRYSSIGNINMPYPQVPPPSPAPFPPGTVYLAGVQAKVLYSWQAGAGYWANIPGHNEVDLGAQMTVAGLEQTWYSWNDEPYTNAYIHKNYITAMETFNHYIRCFKGFKVYFGLGVGEGFTSYQEEKIDPVQGGTTTYVSNNATMATAMLFANIKLSYQVSDKVSVVITSKPVVLTHEFVSNTYDFIAASSDLSLGADIAL